MMNGFTNHSIKHSSASQINQYANAPCSWVAKYLHGKKFSFGAAPKAGILVEDAVVDVIARGLSLDEATHKAMKEYNKFTSIGATTTDIKRGEGMPFMIEETVERLKKYGKPEFDNHLTDGPQQKKIELICKADDWEIPIIGYIDFYYPDLKLIVDLKTTMRLPTMMSKEHQRQGSIYSKAMDCDVIFLYVTPKKSVWHDVINVDETLKEIKQILTRQERMLSAGDIKTITSLMPVNQGSYYWTGDEDIRKELFGI